MCSLARAARVGASQERRFLSRTSVGRGGRRPQQVRVVRELLVILAIASRIPISILFSREISKDAPQTPHRHLAPRRGARFGLGPLLALAQRKRALLRALLSLCAAGYEGLRRHGVSAVVGVLFFTHITLYILPHRHTKRHLAPLDAERTCRPDTPLTSTTSTSSHRQTLSTSHIFSPFRVPTKKNRSGFRSASVRLLCERV